jgi:hypothetical protein
LLAYAPARKNALPQTCKNQIIANRLGRGLALRDNLAQPSGCAKLTRPNQEKKKGRWWRLRRHLVWVADCQPKTGNNCDGVDGKKYGGNNSHTLSIIRKN